MKKPLLDDATVREIERISHEMGCEPGAVISQALDAWRRQRESIYVSAPVNALVEGLYEQDMSIGTLKSRGDFGLGTFNDLDGEMVLLDGEVFQLKADGTVQQVDDEVMTPFACVCFFEPDVGEKITHPYSYTAFTELLAQCLPSQNMLYACRVEGTFSSVRTRSVPRQKNYRPLVEVTRDQIETVQRDIRGTLVGFYNPTFISSVNVPGWHFHFLSEDRRCGDHLLECHVKEGQMDLQHHALMQLGLPVTLDYLTAEFCRDTSEDLEEAEH